ncbi:MAG: NitT/TauT family transport system permease protein [Methylobacteriaceae bacterium]|jgi:NitT/TauT family transport system permease protein|nr:NitT/TauT family transport system permease protein [Methylobacteriaceae bacterium]
MADREAVNSGDTPPSVVTPASSRVQMQSVLPVRKTTTEGQRDVLATILVVIAMLTAMQIASAYVPDYVMPAPLAVLAATKDLLFSDKTHILVTLARLTGAVAFSMVIGVVIGGAMGTIGFIRPILRAIIVIDTGIPALSWMLVAVFWFRDAEMRIFFILTVILLPFYALNVYEGIRALPRDLIDMVESFRPSRWQVLYYLVIPHIVPYIFLTTKSVIGYAIRMAVFAELIASAIGIGSRMNLAQSTFRIDQVFAWTFLLVVLNIALQAAVSAFEKVALKWRPEVKVR